ncbi:MAG: hypothetical protein J6D47_02220, partial [Peptostreptococcaceae bacterium]|nr:hypothetical protein [Peptostreptococcaceae bacterium]
IYSLGDLEGYNAKYKESKKKANSTSKNKKPLTRFHNINSNLDKYTPEELDDVLRKSQEAKYGKQQAKPVNPSDFVVTEEIYQDALINWTKYTGEQKIDIRRYARANNKFMPEVWTLRI